MLARTLRLLLACQLLAFSALAVWLADASPIAAAGSALLAVLLMQAVPVGLSYVFAYRYRARAPRLSLWQTLRMLGGEYLAAVAAFVVIFPCERWWMRDEPLPGPAGRAGKGSGERPPILLLHGYCCSRGSWWWLRTRLRAAGWRVATINLEPVFADIDDYLEPLARRIDEVLAAHDAQQLVLVGHSMGGLVARAYLQRYGAGKVQRLLTLGTPHQGSELARLGLGTNGRQMRPGSAWLCSLHPPPTKVDAVPIYSPHDSFVLPQTNLLLPGTRCVAVPGVGHLAMLFSPRVARALLSELA